MCVAALEFGPATQASVDNPNRCEVKYGDERVIDMRNLCDWHTVGRNCGASVSGTGVNVERDATRDGVVPREFRVRLGGYACTDAVRLDNHCTAHPDDERCQGREPSGTLCGESATLPTSSMP